MIIRPPLDPERAEISELMQRRARHDGRPALSEHKALRVGATESAELVAVDASVIGYAIAAHHPGHGADVDGHWAVEVATSPEIGGEAAVSAALIETIAEAIPAGERATVWAWRSAQLAAVRDLGLAERRVLVEMRVGLPVDAEASVPDGFEIGRFRPGEDDAAWLAANNAAFAGHPENAALDAANLALRKSLPWFDPNGFLIAWRGGRLEGFCWTKRHGETLGEIYIIGVVPEAQGRGLGRALLVEGLHDLCRRQGVAEALLFTDATDRRAARLYRSLGFEVASTNREFEL